MDKEQVIEEIFYMMQQLHIEDKNKILADWAENILQEIPKKFCLQLHQHIKENGNEKI